MDDEGCFMWILLFAGLIFGFLGGCEFYKGQYEKEFKKGFKQGQIEASKGNWKYKQVEVKTWVKNKEEVK